MPQRSSDTYEHIDEEERALESFLTELKNIKGFKASAVMTNSGEILASEITDLNINLYNFGAIFNDIFQEAHNASEKIGLETCIETTINTPKGLIIMRCSGHHSPVHFHLIAILSNDGNQALAKLELEKIIPLIMHALV